MPLAPHQQRVVDERYELADKLAKLDEFIDHNPLFKTLDNKDQMLLLEQSSVMTQYKRLLDRRIYNFPL